MWEIGIDDVLDANTVRSAVTESTSETIDPLRSRLSNTASMTRSVSANPVQSVDPLTRSIAFSPSRMPIAPP